MTEIDKPTEPDPLAPLAVNPTSAEGLDWVVRDQRSDIQLLDIQLFCYHPKKLYSKC
ncbi:hypothetical protein GFS31_21210 [Leptolyngbya sp. BL0902]|nr:hypothetical protein GFS31_21210 [Leptolyngbya sp. BL0902]